VVVLIPVFVWGFRTIHGHYQEVARELTLRGLPPSLKPLVAPRVVLPISGVHRGVLEALRYARSISDQVTAVYVEVDHGATEKVRREWETWAPDVPLAVVPSPYRSTLGPLLEFLEQTDREHNDGLRRRYCQSSSRRIAGNTCCTTRPRGCSLALIYQRRRFRHTRVIVDVPFYLQE
jgi:hypothetical protein